MAVIDLNAPTVPEGCRAWRLFPGKGYRFLESMIRDNYAYLEIPGFEMPPPQVRLSDDPDIIAKIALSQELIERAPYLGPAAEAGLLLENFRGAHRTAHRTKLRQAIINLYEEAKAGDFVITPEPLSFGQIRVGRFTSNDISAAQLPNRYGQQTIPARNIQWVGRYPENTISAGLSASLRHENPFTLLERSTFTEVFGLALGSFVFGERHLATIFNDLDDFLDADSALIGAVSRLASAATMSVEENGDFGDLIEILLRSPPVAYTCSQQADIHSRGFNRFTSGTVVALVIAAVIGVLLTMGEAESPDSLQNEIRALEIVNTGANADPACTAKVSAASKRVLEGLGIGNTWTLCKAAHASKRRAGLRSSARPRQ